MCQTTSNLTFPSHLFMTIVTIMLSLYTMSLYTEPMEQSFKQEFYGIVSHTSEPSTSRRSSFKPASQELQPQIKSKHRPKPLPRALWKHYDSVESDNDEVENDNENDNADDNAQNI